MNQTQHIHALYLHIPFCGVQCTYCAFNVYTRRETLIPAYVEALCREIGWVGRAATSPPPLHTIYLGGGTPSLLTAAQVARILRACRAAFVVTPDAEITLEANPGGLDAAYFEDLRACGVNRLSIGMQSAHAAELRLFARDHGVVQVAETMAAARAAGFDNISLDLMYGIPRQTVAMWGASLDAALALQPDHLSLYALQLESGTPLARWVMGGRLPNPDDDLAADMYEAADSTLIAAGFEQYEISTWARPGYECRHNLQYWRNEPFLGAGAGAHGCAGGVRYQVVRDLETYIARANSQNTVLPFPHTAAVDSFEPVSDNQAMDDTLMTGLRLLREGVGRSDFAARYGVSLESVFGEALAKVAPYDMLDLSDDRIRLKPRARLISNQVLLHFIRTGEA